MKKLSLLALIFAPALALANDGGIVGIDATGFKLEKVDNQGENANRTTIDLKDTESIEASFTGDVGELFKLLPGQKSVLPGYGKHFRTLALVANEGFVTINCENAVMDNDKNGRATYTPKPTTCTVSISKYETPVTDEYKYDYFGDFEKLKVPRACRMK